jgi:pantoate--beta-alanine ligase
VKVFRTIAEVRQAIASARRSGAVVGLVPTMGALHAGHASLLAAARSGCDLLVASIFVNPTQFGPGEDFDSYPRPFDADAACCEDCGVDVLFAPRVEEMYPAGPSAMRTTVHVAELGQGLCGATRPGHFDGVCTVVAKLLHIVQPDRAWFGQKDYQQAAILQQMVADLDMPAAIELCPTHRQADGLATSSRNQYLTAEQRRQAPALYGALQAAAQLVAEAHPPARAVIDAMRQHLATHAPSGKIDYLALVDPHTLKQATDTDRPVLAALAVHLGRARLIDNMILQP